VTHAGKDHGQTGFVRSRDNLFVPDRSARLDNRGCPRLCCGDQTISKREKETPRRIEVKVH